MTTITKIQGSSAMPAYLKNKDLFEEVKRAKELGYYTDELAAMHMLMVSKYITHPWWNGYTYKDDMMGHALMSLAAAALKFNPEKSNNPFGYYTEIMKNSFMQVKKQEAKHRNVRDVLLVEHGMEPSFAFTEALAVKEAAELEAKKNAVDPQDELDKLFKF